MEKNKTNNELILQKNIIGYSGMTDFVVQALSFSTLISKSDKLQPFYLRNSKVIGLLATTYFMACVVGMLVHAKTEKWTHMTERAF